MVAQGDCYAGVDEEDEVCASHVPKSSLGQLDVPLVTRGAINAQVLKGRGASKPLMRTC